MKRIMKKSILEILDHSKGYDMALFSTFNFEIEFFERAILSRLIKNNIRQISVFVDAKELAKALSAVESCTLGQHYAVNPVIMHGSYHPKVILLLGDRKARLFVSSANLKTSGYLINNEIFNYIDYDPEHPEYRDVIVAAIQFFMNSYEFTPNLDDALLNNLMEQSL